MQDIFYTVSKELEMAILEDAKEKAFQINLDELDCRISPGRVKTNKTWEEVINIYNTSRFQHFVFIIRKSRFMYPSDSNYREEYIEVGTRSGSLLDDKDYFTFIYLNISDLDYFLNKYSLEVME